MSESVAPDGWRTAPTPDRPLDLDLEEIRAGTHALVAMAYNHDGLQRTAVLWLATAIYDLCWKIERDCPKSS